MLRQLARHRVPRGLIAALEDLSPPPSPPGTRARAKADPAIVHLLERTTFGYSEAELAMAQDLGVEGWIDRQLDPSAIDTTALDTLLVEFFPTLAMGYQEILEIARSAEDPAQPAVELVLATVLRQLYSPRQLFEVMVEFWTNHFNVFLVDGPVLYFKTVDDRDHIRPHALGSFRELLHANARSPAMLYYLDNYSNSRAGPNENYARELLELHTLGVDGGYSEQDVGEVARCFTGWTLAPRHPDVFVFNPVTHDYGAKVVLGRDVPANRGIEDGRQVLDILAGERATYRNVGRKLARRFVSDAPDSAIVERLAHAGAKSRGSIPKLVRTVLVSDAFAASAGAKFKRPVEFVASVLRRLAPRTGDDLVRLLVAQLDTLGQLPYFAAPPTGYGDTRDAWLATSPLLARWNFASAVAYGTLPAGAGVAGERAGPPMDRVIDVPIEDFVGSARAPDALVDRLVERVLHRPVPESDRAALVRLAARDGNPGDALDRATAIDRGRSVLAALLASDHFQSR